MAFAQDMKQAKALSNALEDGKSTQRIYKAPTVTDNAVPLYTITGSDGFWDYMTNGANMQNIAVFGDTVIVCYPNTDSSDATGLTSRIAYYMISYDGGASWGTPLAISTLPNRSGYPEVYSYIAGGTRQVAFSGRKYTTASFGGAWKDAFLGLGSITGANVPLGGKDFFGAYQSGTTIGGLTSFSSATEDTLYYNKYDANSNTFGNRVLVANAGNGTIGFNVRYNMASDQTGNNLVSVWYKDTTSGIANTGLAMSTSTNGGTTWSFPTFIQKNRRVNDFIGGDSLTPWFGIDVAYKPATTNFGVVWSTLYANTAAGTYNSINTASKILFYSPNINGGVPTIVAGRQNMNIISDTSLFNNTQGLQVGVLPVSHPSIAYSADGSRIYVAFSAFQPGDSLDGFTYNDIYWTVSDDGGLTWATPKNLTNTHTDDELYPTISLTGNTNTMFHVKYQSTKGPGSSSFTDNAPVYRVYQCYQKVSTVGVNNISTTVPDKFSLKQNYPNPFNPTTSIRFDVTKASRMTLNIYDASGKLVQTLINNEVVPTGTNEVVFDAAKLSSGVYFYTLSSDSFRETKKMMLVK